MNFQDAPKIDPRLLGENFKGEFARVGFANTLQLGVVSLKHQLGFKQEVTFVAVCGVLSRVSKLPNAFKSQF